MHSCRTLFRGHLHKWDSISDSLQLLKLLKVQTLNNLTVTF